MFDEHRTAFVAGWTSQHSRLVATGGGQSWTAYLDAAPNQHDAHVVATGVTIDHAGDVIVAGYVYHGGLAGQDGLSAQPYAPFPQEFLQAYKPDGTVLWNRQFSSASAASTDVNASSETAAIASTDDALVVVGNYSHDDSVGNAVYSAFVQRIVP